MRAGRARRVEVPEELPRGLAAVAYDYVSVFELSTPTPQVLTPEQWARATWETAPRLVRLLMAVGWRFVLGLRLGPTGSPRYVLGWLIAASDERSIVVEASSPLISTRNALVVDGVGVRWFTAVRFDGRGAAPLWSLVAPVHHALIPYLLTGASRSADRKVATSRGDRPGPDGT